MKTRTQFLESAKELSELGCDLAACAVLELHDRIYPDDDSLIEQRNRATLTRFDEQRQLKEIP